MQHDDGCEVGEEGEEEGRQHEEGGEIEDDGFRESVDHDVQKSAGRGGEYWVVKKKKEREMKKKLD